MRTRLIRVFNVLRTSHAPRILLPAYLTDPTRRGFHSSPVLTPTSTSTYGRAPLAAKMARIGDTVDLTGDSDDEELQRAITLSQQTQDDTAPEDGDDEDLKRAIAASLEDDVKPPPPPDELEASGEAQRNAQNTETRAIARLPAIPTPQYAQSPSSSQSSLSAILGLDRKAMEAERLARLKRKRGDEPSISPPPTRRAIKSPTLPPRKVTASAYPHAPTVRPPPSASAYTPTPPASQATASSTQLYPDGIVKQTFSSAHPRTGKDIKFSELVDASNLQSCVLSSFIWDFDWLFPHFKTKTTKFVLVMQGKDQASRQQIEKDFNNIPNIRICFPPMDGIVNCMHSKLMLLFYAGRCRVVVPSANLMGFDWGVGGVMENTVWFIDLPKKSDDDDVTDTTGFERSLIQFLKAKRVPDDVLRKLNQFDFGNTAKIGFVHTIGGMHGDDDWRTTGHCGLGRTITELGLASTEPIQLDFVASSIGSLNDEFMRSIYLAAQGDDGLSEYTLRTTKKLPMTVDSRRKVSKDTGKDWRDNFRFYFPTDETVADSLGGKPSAGTVCFSRKWWDGAKMPQHAIRNCVSARQGLLMHNKVRQTLSNLAMCPTACPDLWIDHVCKICET